MENKNNKLILVIVIILCLVIIGMLGYLIYQNIDKDNSNEENKNLNNNETVNISDLMNAKESGYLYKGRVGNLLYDKDGNMLIEPDGNSYDKKYENIDYKISCNPSNEDDSWYLYECEINIRNNSFTYYDDGGESAELIVTNDKLITYEWTSGDIGGKVEIYKDDKSVLNVEALSVYKDKNEKTNYFSPKIIDNKLYYVTVDVNSNKLNLNYVDLNNLSITNVETFEGRAITEE